MEQLKEPMTREAVCLALIDNLDSRMAGFERGDYQQARAATLNGQNRANVWSAPVQRAARRGSDR